MFFIYQTEAIFNRIELAWDKFCTSYKRDEKVKVVRLQTLRYEFNNLRINDSEFIEDYFCGLVVVRIKGEEIENKHLRRFYDCLDSFNPPFG